MIRHSTHQGSPWKMLQNQQALSVASLGVSSLVPWLTGLVVNIAIAFLSIAQAAQPLENTPGPASHLLAIVGSVEFARAGSDTWVTGKTGDRLFPGDRLRTQARSRATIRLSDRSVLRVRERTLLMIGAEEKKKRGSFNLLRGALFFLNREKPNQIEFTTPLASGAIRGTEFLIEVDETTGEMDLAVFQGEVALQADQAEWSVKTGEQIHVAPNTTPTKTPLIHATNLIQWALYYPIFLTPKDLPENELTDAQTANSIAHYRSGNLRKALQTLPPSNEADLPSAYELAVMLSAGRVDDVDRAMATIPFAASLERAFRLLLAAVRFQTLPTITPPESASEALALSYYYQAHSDLTAAREAAKAATGMAPEFGPTWIRLAELEFSFAERTKAQSALHRGLALAPEQAQGQALLGFVALENNDTGRALQHFEQAIQLDGDLGNAWLGKGIALLKQHQAEPGAAALQTAAALEPQRSLFRSYLGKAFGQLRESELATKEFGIARTLDPSDPTVPFYEALHAFQENRINDSIRLLEESIDLNDNQSVHRSRALLDRDLAIRSADLSLLYNEAGLSDVSDYVATRSILQDPSNFSGHLFWANSLQKRERELGFDRRLESARASELLMANLLAPVGGGNLSQLLSQQDRLQYFGPRAFGFNTQLEYLSHQAWRQQASAFGTIDQLSYAVDGLRLDQSGQRPHQDHSIHQGSVQLKYQLKPTDSLYLQVGTRFEEGDDLRRYYNPNTASPNVTFESEQPANVYLGYHHEWSPNSHTLFLAARLEDQFQVSDTDPRVLFLRQAAGTPASLQTSPSFDLDLQSDFSLYSAELQHLQTFGDHSLIVGTRWQSGEVDQTALLSRDLTGIVDRHQSNPDMHRANAYAYYTWEIDPRLRLIGGISYDHLEAPLNTDLAPIDSSTRSQDKLSPKIGLTFEPWHRGELRAAYTRSLGGLFFDNSVRLEPSLVAGFNQSYRSLVPESTVGLVPGSEFETVHASFNQSFKSGTYLGITGEILESTGERSVGALTNGSALPIPDQPTAFRQRLDYREESITAFAYQLIGSEWAPGIRYRYRHATLSDQFPGLAPTLPGLGDLSQANEATLQELSLFARYNHASGFFARWESNFYHQNNHTRVGLADDQFWHHNLYLGYRLPHRRAQIEVGLLNLADTDYRLNPINLYGELPRRRTISVLARFNF